MSHYLKSQQRKINAALAVAGKASPPALKAVSDARRGAKARSKPRAS